MAKQQFFMQEHLVSENNKCSYMKFSNQIILKTILIQCFYF